MVKFIIARTNTLIGKIKSIYTMAKFTVEKSKLNFRLEICLYIPAPLGFFKLKNTRDVKILLRRKIFEESSLPFQCNQRSAELVCFSGIHKVYGRTHSYFFVYISETMHELLCSCLKRYSSSTSFLQRTLTVVAHFHLLVI